MIQHKEIYLVCRRSLEGVVENVWAFVDKEQAENYTKDMNLKASKYLTYYVEGVSLT